MSQKNLKNQWQKQFEKKLSVESLESRQLLSAVPFTANPDIVDATAVYAPANDEAYVDFSAVDNAPIALQGESFNDNVGQLAPVIVNSVGTQINVNFAAEANQPYTILTELRNPNGTASYSSYKVTPAANTIQDGRFTYSFNGTTDRGYSIRVVKGSFSSIQQAYNASRDDILGDVWIKTAPTYSFAALPNQATSESVAFQVKNLKNHLSADDLVFSAKFDGAATASTYTVENHTLYCDGEATPYSVNATDYDYYNNCTFTIYGLAPNKKQTFQVAIQNSENTISPYSSVMTITTAKTSKVAPVEVRAALNLISVPGIDYSREIPDGNALVTWMWLNDEDTTPTTFTITSSYTDARGRVITKTETTNATVDENGDGSFVVSKLQPNQQYTFSVSANKSTEYNASAFVSVTDCFNEPIISPTTIPAPTLQKVAGTDTTTTFQITNWDKMEAALQEEQYSCGGTIVIVNTLAADIDDAELAVFSFVSDNEEWYWNNDCGSGIMDISNVNNKNVATITLTDLEANTNYGFQAYAFNNSQNDNINCVGLVTSQVQKVKTELPANPKPTAVTAMQTTADGLFAVATPDITVEWQGAAGLTYTIAYSYTDARGNVVTKNATTNATVDAEGKGSFKVTRLLPNTEYTFSVSANKNKDHSLSPFSPALAPVVTATTIPAPTLTKVAGTDTSITFQVTNWDKMQAALQEVYVEVWQGNVWQEGGAFYFVNTADPNNQMVGFGYDGENETLGWHWADGDLTGTMEVNKVNNRDVATVTITGLTANTNYSFQALAFSDVQNDNIDSVALAASSVMKVKTELPANPKPENVKAEQALRYDLMSNANSSDVMVTWEGEADLKYTVAYSYTDARGNVVTKNATTNASVDEYGYGEFVVKNLQPNTEYAFSVSANKDKDHSLSPFAPAEETVITATTIPAPTLSKVGGTDTTITFQVTNWDKMESALQETDGINGGSFVVGNFDEYGYQAVAWFIYNPDDEGNWGWHSEDSWTSTMDVEVVRNKDVATVTITDLDANTNYNFKAFAYSTVENDNLNHVALALSNALRVKTELPANPEPTDVSAFKDTIDSNQWCIYTSDACVSWTGQAGLTYTVAYSYTDAKGNVVKKNATTNAAVDENGNGEFVVKNLLPNTEYAFSVSANKDKDHSLSPFAPADSTVVTLNTIPAPTLSKVGGTDTSITFQITNWDKMQAALQEIDSDYNYGGSFAVVDANDHDKAYAFFDFVTDEGGNWVWSLRDDDAYSGTMEISKVNNKDVAKVTVSGLTASTNYSFQAFAYSDASNDNTPGVGYVISTVQKVKTELPANPTPTDVYAVQSTIDSNFWSIYGNNAVVDWKGGAGLTYTIAYSYTDARGNVVTKNATTNAAVDKDGNGTFEVKNLQPNTEYAFSVSANKDKDHSLSPFAPAEETVITAATIPAPTLSKVAGTDTTITFQVTNWDKLESALQETEAGMGGEFVIVDANDIDNVYSWFFYDTDETGLGWHSENENYSGTIDINNVRNKNVATVTVSGLDPNTNYNFKALAFSSRETENINHVAYAISSAQKVKTELPANPTPTAVTALQTAADGLFAAATPDITVEWQGAAGLTYTIAYSYTDARGNVVTKNATTNAAVDAAGKGSFKVTRLLPNTEYTFSVSANKNKDHSLSPFAPALEPVVTATTIPAPTLTKVAGTDTSITFQVTNWDKMQAALQEVDNVDEEGGAFYFVNTADPNNQMVGFYYCVENETLGWYWDDGDLTGTMEINKVNNRDVATVTITGLTANTNYSFQAFAFSNAQNDNIDSVALATSSVMKVKTEITAYAPVTELGTSNVTFNSMGVSWTGSENATSYIVTATPINGGNKVTKTVNGTSTTLTGLVANTDYEVSVVAKADRNGSQSLPTSINQRTAEKLELKSVTKVNGATNQYSLNFGVDMTQYSGRLDFTVNGSGRVYVPQYNRWVSDSITPTTVSLFYGVNANDLADAYQTANPNANVLVMDENGSFQTLDVSLRTNGNYQFGFGFRFVESENVSTLGFDFDAGGYQYSITGTVKLTGADLTHNTIQGKTLSATLSKDLQCSFSN